VINRQVVVHPDFFKYMDFKRTSCSPGRSPSPFRIIFPSIRPITGNVLVERSCYFSGRFTDSRTVTQRLRTQVPACRWLISNFFPADQTGLHGWTHSPFRGSPPRQMHALCLNQPCRCTDFFLKVCLDASPDWLIFPAGTQAGLLFRNHGMSL
jgi:hypothetical protein